MNGTDMSNERMTLTGKYLRLFEALETYALLQLIVISRKLQIPCVVSA